MKDILDKEEDKAPLLKIKHILILFFIGLALTTLGALFKLESWPYASELLIVGFLIKFVSFILAIVKLLSLKGVKSFLNK